MNKPLTRITQSGVKKLEEELENLKTVVRPEIAEKIKQARSFGDLSENSEYDEAKNEQGLIESRIAEIEQTLAHAIILGDDEISTEKVDIGNIVTILDVDMEEQMTFQIVGTSEANIENGHLSDESPIGKALIGHTAGETVIAETPSGEIPFKILEIAKADSTDDADLTTN